MTFRCKLTKLSVSHTHISFGGCTIFMVLLPWVLLLKYRYIFLFSLFSSQSSLSFYSPFYQKLLKYYFFPFVANHLLNLFSVISPQCFLFHPQFLVFNGDVLFGIQLKLSHSLYYFKQLWQHFLKPIQVFPQKQFQSLQILLRDHQK